MVLLCSLAALVVSLAMPKTYKATTSLVVNYKGTDSVTGAAFPTQLTPAFMATQVDIIANLSTALKVVDELNLTSHPKTRERFVEETQGKGDIREWRAQQLLKKIEVSPSSDSNVLSITANAPEAKEASAIANAFAEAYQEVSVHLRVEPSKKAAVYFNDQIKSLRDKFELAQKKVTSFQQENGIVSTEQHLDVETFRLNELSNQLSMAQAQAIEAVSRSKETSGGLAGASPDVAANPVVQDLRIKLAASEAKLAVLSQSLTEYHPHYKEALIEVQTLRGDLNKSINASARSVANNARILERREADLRSAVAAQKARVMEVTRKRAELKMLTNEMDAAQRSYEMAAQRFMQANLEGQSNLADISVLTAATAPIKHATPKIRLNVLFATVFGLMLGVGLAMLNEFFDRRVRSPHDLSNLIDVPVFEVMGQHRTAARRLAMPTVLLPYRQMPN